MSHREDYAFGRRQLDERSAGGDSWGRDGYREGPASGEYRTNGESRSARSPHTGDRGDRGSSGASGERPVQPFRPMLRAGGERFAREAANRPILMFEDVYKSYRPGAPVLRGMNLIIERGEFVFITGPSGSGKSTLLRILYAAEKPDDGRILFLGRDIARLRDESIPVLRRNLGVIFQDFKLVQSWSVFENVAITLEVLGLPGRLIKSRVGEALERVGLQGRGGDPAGVLSGGEQQRVAIARAIVGEPALILADEPTGNLDPQLALDVLGLFEEIHESGTTVLFATHDRSLLDVRPRRLIVLDEGKAVDVPNGVGAEEEAMIYDNELPV